MYYTYKCWLYNDSINSIGGVYMAFKPYPQNILINAILRKTEGKIDFECAKEIANNVNIENKYKLLFYEGEDKTYMLSREERERYNIQHGDQFVLVDDYTRKIIISI